MRFSGPGLSGTVGLSQSAVAIGGSQPVYAEVELNADGEGAPTPSAIAVVIDVSGSMRGQKIEQAIRGAETLVTRMREEDWVSIVAYSDRARMIVAPTLLRYGRQEALRAVRRLYADGGTNIREGLMLGASTLNSAPIGFTKRVLLLSDGQDTYGANAYEAARTTVNIAGATTISALGIGHDYDESFMNTVATVGQGNYAFLAHTERMYAFFENELRQSNGTTADRVRVALRIPNGWIIQRSFGAELQRVGNELAFDVGAITRGYPRRVVVEMRVPAQQPGFLGQMGADIRYYDPRGQAERVLTAEGLALRAVNSAPEALASRDINVFARSRALALAEEQSQALDAWRNGDAERARQMSANVERESRALRAAAPAAAPVLDTTASVAAEAQQNYHRAPSSSEGAAFGRANRARSSAATRAQSDALSTY